MGWAVFFLALLAYCTGIDGQLSWTQPPTSSVSLGGTISLSCTTQSTSTIHWNQQKVGEAPRFVHCDGCSNRGEGIPNRFTATGSGTTGTLTITNAQVEDEADYYCVSWHNNEFIFGGGTQLTVTGQPTVPPTLNAFAPAEEELKTQSKVTLVCTINDFYPPGFNLKWKGGNEEITSGVETTKANKQGDKYVASSYLTLSASDYQNNELFICEVTHGGKTFAKTVRKSGSC